MVSRWNRSYADESLASPLACSVEIQAFSMGGQVNNLAQYRRLTMALLLQRSPLCTRPGCMSDKQDQQLVASQNKDRTLVARLSSRGNLLSQLLQVYSCRKLAQVLRILYRNGQMAVQE